MAQIKIKALKAGDSEQCSWRSHSGELIDDGRMHLAFGSYHWRLQS
jgi:hypothetical protein